MLTCLYQNKEKCFEKIPIYYQDGDPAKIFALDPDGNDYYLSTPTQVKQDPPAHSQPSEIRSTIQSSTFSAHRAGLYSPKHIKGFWNRILSTKHSHETIHLLGKTISYYFVHDSNPTSEDKKRIAAILLDKTMPIGTTHRTLILITFFTRNGFKTMLNNTFGWPHYILIKWLMQRNRFSILQ